MPLVRLELTGDGANGLESGVYNASPGHIEAITCFVKDGTTVPGNTRVQVAVCGPRGTIDSKRATVIDGYVYNGGDAAWDGHIFLEEGETLLFTLRSPDTPTVVMQGKTLQFDP